jgi:hypothetical protein
MRATLSSAVVLLFAVVGCSQRHPISTAVQPPPATIRRTLIETPSPARIPDLPLPALKPGTELSLAESEALADQASPKPPLETQSTASQRAMGRAVKKTANLPGAGAKAPPVTDALHLMGLSQIDTTKLFGEPAERKNFPPSQIWIYHSTVCDLKMFFYPEVGGPFRALTILMTTVPVMQHTIPVSPAWLSFRLAEAPTISRRELGVVLVEQATA